MRAIQLSVGLALVAGVSAAQAASINTLFYGASTTWNSNLATLAAGANTYDPLGDGSNTWNASFWNAGAPTPDLTAYDALFIPSSGTFGSGMDPSRLLGARSEIEAARGSRTFVTGQDADWHLINRPGFQDDGPRGFIINAVNWAASGTGLGIVSMADGAFSSGSQWWLDPDSFLRDELIGATQYFQDDTVFIGPGQESFPVNEGLTSAGLSNWRISSHAGFGADIDGFTPINFEGAEGSGRAVTIVTEGEASGGTDGSGPTPIPAPSTLLLVGSALLGLRWMRRHG